MFVPEAIILAGGLGTRLQGEIGNLPKALAPVNGRPFLEYLLDYLSVYEVDHVVLSVGYKAEKIRDHFGKAYKSINIDYAWEKEPLGTGGGIKKAFDMIDGSKALVFNGDTMFRIDLIRLFDFHSSRLSKFSLVLREVDDISRFGAVEVDEDRKVTGFFEKGEKSGKGLINGGVYLISRKFFEENEFPEKFSIEKDCFEKLYQTFPFYGLICRQYFIDIGIPEDYQKAQHDFTEFIH
ncbi:MAG: nucleotidyltransferase family protein [Bacteroidales bacterium]|nr:nucleotidyltransferase family protein [Bacteroidales bacterium]